MSGSLACVGIGMTLGAHICPLARSYIEQADVVFSGVSDSVVELWLQEMHSDVRSLQVYYAEGKSRHITYREMVEAMLSEVRAGKKWLAHFMATQAYLPRRRTNPLKWPRMKATPR